MNSEKLTEQVVMKYGTVERERRFLIQALPSDLNLQDYRRIDDRYLPNTFLRLRQITTPEGDVIQQKFARKEAVTSNSCQAQITNLYLTSIEYNLLSALDASLLCKRRYRYSYLEFTIGIDVFEAPLTGLMLAEIEFSSDAAMAQFEPPDFCTIEVTDHSFFRGGHLATVDAEQLSEMLQIYFGN